MNSKFCTIAVIFTLLIFFTDDALCQIQRRSNSQLPQKTENKATESRENVSSNMKKQNESITNNKEKVPNKKKNDKTSRLTGGKYIISYEGEDKVYTDVLPDIMIGDVIEVLGESEPFIHPVTGKRIAREENILGYLIVEEIFNDYMRCGLAKNSSLDSSSVGARITKTSQSPDSLSVKKHKEASDAESGLSPKSTAANQFFQKMLDNEQANLPLEMKGVKLRIDPYTIELKVLYRNVVYLKKKMFEKAKKNILKDYNSETLQKTAKIPLFMMAHDAGYKVFIRCYNPDKTDFFIVEIPVR